jgi:bleomycin hydrolase
MTFSPPKHLLLTKPSIYHPSQSRVSKVTMGAQPSKPTLHEKAVMERLRSLQLQEDDEYVEITGDAEKRVVGPLTREAQGLSVHVLESWQSAILKDPKNK